MTTRRLALVDALRGIAASGVVLFHLYYQNLKDAWAAPLPEPIHSIFRHGNLGVYVFFVLSGFVITLSATRDPPSPKLAGRFVLRRVLRLDPPYWATIALGVFFIAVSNVLLHDRHLPVPAPGNIISHLFYLQHLLGFDDIVPVFWTLAIEIQFYLLVVAGLLVDWWWARRGLPKQLSPSFAIFLVFYLISVLAPEWVDAHVSRALFLTFWPSFFLGVVAFRVMESRTSWKTALALGAIAAISASMRADPTVLTGVATFALFALAIHRRRISQWSGGGLLQFLGRISYSLYLTHTLVGSRVVHLGLRLFPQPLVWPHVVALVSVGAIVSLVTAQIFYSLVERPSVNLSRRVTSV
jgi:peptidoglycan/LPS O-acetylase OafA/YrhL